jgi:hypothetical protein
MKCCLCKGEIEATLDKNGNIIGTFGHNPEPLVYEDADSNRCCDKCNREKVIPVRIFQLYSTNRNTDKT